MPSHLCLDHIIILVPYATLEAPPTWLTQNFTITPGGQHADGKTANNLVCFQDGSYLEFVAFINDDPKLREGHWWGNKSYGIVDFAFSNTDAITNYTELQSRLEAIESCEVRYEAPQQGGRKRPDGEEIKWQVTFPKVGEGFQRGELPFFCHDVTKRELRVPYSEANTTHPSFAYGIKGLLINVPKGKVKTLTQAYEAILGIPNVSVAEDVGCFEVERGVHIDGAPKIIDFTIQSPQEGWQIKAMEERAGLLLGDMIVGSICMAAPQGAMFRIDVGDDIGEFGIGRVFRDLDPPPS